MAVARVIAIAVGIQKKQKNIVSTIGLSPMKLQLSEMTKKADKNIFSTNIPGPLTLANVTKDLYQIQHPLLSDFNTTNNFSLESDILAKMHLGFKQQACDDKTQLALDITPILTALSEIAARSNKFLAKKVN